MSLWKHLIGKAEFHDGMNQGRSLITSEKTLARDELCFIVDRYGVEGAIKYFKGFLKAYNETLNKNEKAISNYRNPYQLGEQLAQKKEKIPRNSIGIYLKGKTTWQAKAALKLITDGYNDRLREHHKSQADLFKRNISTEVKEIKKLEKRQKTRAKHKGNSPSGRER